MRTPPHLSSGSVEQSRNGTTIPLLSSLLSGLMLLVFIFSARADSLVLKNDLPSDPRYWSYRKALEQKVSLSLLVDADDLGHLNRNLEILKGLGSENVIPAEVFFFSSRWNHTVSVRSEKNKALTAQEKELAAKAQGYLKALGLKNFKLINAEKIKSDLRVEFSPVWIISWKAREYLYEGLAKPGLLFAENGIYKGQNANVSTKRRSTNNRLKSRISLSELKRRLKTSAPDGSPENAGIPIIARVFYSENAGVSVADDALPDCQKSSLRNMEVLPDDKGLEDIDLIAYRYDSFAQKNLARSLPQAYPYIPGDLSNPYREKNNQTQDVLRILGLRCLPTAVQHVTRGTKHYIQYREGAKAWTRARAQTRK